VLNVVQFHNQLQYAADLTTQIHIVQSAHTFVIFWR